MSSARLVLFVSENGYESAWQATSFGLTAAAMGDEVLFVMAFDALRGLATASFGHPSSDAQQQSWLRSQSLRAPIPSQMLEDARRLGAKVVACETTVKLCGLEPERLTAEKRIDEILGLPEIWRLTVGARVLSF